MGDSEPGANVMTVRRLTATLHREGGQWVSLCPELDVASQGPTIEQAKANLREAVELFLETASPEEVADRLHEETYVSPLEVEVG